MAVDVAAQTEKVQDIAFQNKYLQAVILLDITVPVLSQNVKNVPLI